MPMKNLPDSREHEYVKRMTHRAISKLGLQVEESDWDKLNRKYMVRVTEQSSGKTHVVRIGQALVERCMTDRKDDQIISEIFRQVREGFPELSAGRP